MLIQNELLNVGATFILRKDINTKKHFLSGIARMRGGGLPMPEFFGPFSRSAFLVDKKSKVSFETEVSQHASTGQVSQFR